MIPADPQTVEFYQCGKQHGMTTRVSVFSFVSSSCDLLTPAGGPT